MIRLFAISVAFVTASAASADTFFHPAPSFAGPHPAIVRVAVADTDGGASYGSGTLVAVNESSGLVLTNWHVVRDGAGPIMVYFPNGFRSGAYLLRVDRDWDLAALAIRRPNVQPVSIANETPRPGDELTIAGYGSGSYRAVTGRLTQYVSPGGELPYEMIELSAPARNGDSGGPILNSRGELAGTLFGSAFGRTTGSYCGRLRWFVNAVDGDFQRISAQAMLAQQSRGNAPPVASSNATLPMAQVAPYSANQATSSSWPGEGLAARTAGTESGTALAQVNTPGKPARSTAGESASTTTVSIPASPAATLPRTDQIKSILALLGALAVLYHAIRFLGWAVG